MAAIFTTSAPQLKLDQHEDQQTPRHHSLDQPLHSTLRTQLATLPTPIKAPFGQMRRLLDTLLSNPTLAASLNNTYPKRGIFKTAALTNTNSDQKLTLDISPSRLELLPASLRTELGPDFDAVVSFFQSVERVHVPQILAALSQLVGFDMSRLHAARNLNFRLCDYIPSTANPDSSNGCGAHRDYGTFSIIFQDKTALTALEAEVSPGIWVPVPPDATVVVCGWCAAVLSGGEIKAVRHRVRRVPGVRRISAVLFVAPDLEVKLRPFDEGKWKYFSDEIIHGNVDVEGFKEVMGKKWRHREGNEDITLNGQDSEVDQDDDIQRLVWAD
ncbi:MAG: hypothetical protein HETSPECPRED_002480 [Heterodermia speciosa]|uniref:Fe2OG dioxygenase domain-containing protein n=1 Tax=Heterodermia speciosa TaxID=116794 RepID=A0A8H3PH17_9LECA|nr:MAG: hypothetical protein HETSPECPRED_002480 [Heterodermia speciosa]